MKNFTCEVFIDLPKSKVVELFNDPDNLQHWQDGFLDFKHMEGEPGAVGSTAQMEYKMGKGKMIIHEEILSNNLPDEFTGKYTHTHTTNTMKNEFIALSENETHYKAEVNYSRLSGLLKVMLFFKKDMLQNPVQKWMNQFKEFAESRG